MKIFRVLTCISAIATGAVAAVSTDTNCGIPGDAEHVCTWIAESK